MKLQQLINIVIPLIVGFAPFFIAIWTIIFIRKLKTSRSKNPITAHLLRSPGQTLIKEAEEIGTDLLIHLLYIPFVSLFFYSYYLTTSRSALSLTLMVITILIFMSIFVYKIVKLANKKENLRLGYDAELAVGQELNLLMRFGFYVFHDVNLKNTISEFNIDHVVVGKSGVFAIETKGRSKEINSNGDYTYKVTFDGGKLIFPNHEEIKPVDQAKRQSVALQKWLTSAVGEPIKVKAVIALPGWFITTTKKTDLTVINGKNPEKFFNLNKEPLLSEKLIKQIAHQLESLCRNVEPRAYSILR